MLQTADMMNMMHDTGFVHSPLPRSHPLIIWFFGLVTDMDMIKICVTFLMSDN